MDLNIYREGGAVQQSGMISFKEQDWRTLQKGLFSIIAHFNCLFISKARVTYSYFNFPLKRCFLNIYKKHVSQKKGG
jgi:hypothetical protein